MTDRNPVQTVIVWLVRLVTQDLLAAISDGGDNTDVVVLGALADAQEAEGRALWEDT